MTPHSVKRQTAIPMTSSLTFPVALTPEAHDQAQRASEGHANGLRAKQAYLNGLARFAVSQYLQCMGLLPETQVPTGEAAPSALPTTTQADLALALLSETTAVSVPDLGQLECCALLPGEQRITVPPEARSDEPDRIGYVAVQLDHALRSACITGFVSRIAGPEGVLELAELGSLETLLQQLHGLIHEPNLVQPQQSPINLTHWFQNTFEQGWQICNDLLRAPTLEPAMGFRSPRLTGKKPISLGAHHELALIMTLVQKPDHRTRIEIQVVAPEPLQLPKGLALSVLDDQAQIFLEAHLSDSSSALSVQPFTGAAGEQFTLAIRLDDIEFREHFIA